MPRDFYSADFPLEPCQFGGNAGLQRTEPSGEILCPLKMAHIGIMRCGEYQERFDCGDGCAAKAAAEDIARLRDETKFLEGAGYGTYVCARCGGLKKFPRSELCMRCGNIESNKLNHRGRGL